ncbi:hypothetical protein GCM10017691_21820 [Pseudonocardia petroleophila]|uniref:Uncharacterized protein n=1 Tax=Pseudonocardia petroleophila TaxID=37331 RepID=A0A7G7MGE2_9PSEU|nr:hypothetical protein [Pseudonocardia petroleophila]QNG51853.1 hypothetical protein H6H00_27780 [Pseudonocardia petroleophila]
MTTALVVIVLVGLAVWLSAARPSLPLPGSSVAPDSYDRERQLAELRALSRSRADVHL